MADILEEVMHDQSDEKKLRYFTKALPIVIFITTLVVVSMVINNWYEDKKINHDMRIGDLLIKQLSNEDKKASLDSLDNIVKNSDGSKVAEIAMLEQVAINISDEDYGAAKILLETIINNKNYYGVTTSYARLIWIGLVIDEVNISKEDREKLQNYLDYFNNDHIEFFGTASIMKAIWFQKNNKKDLAAEVLRKTISLENVPQIIREQGRALLSNLEK